MTTITSPELQLKWDELPEITDINLFSFSPLQSLLKLIIDKVNENNARMREWELQREQERLEREEKEKLLRREHSNKFSLVDDKQRQLDDKINELGNQVEQMNNNFEELQTTLRQTQDQQVHSSKDVTSAISTAPLDCIPVPVTTKDETKNLIVDNNNNNNNDREQPLQEKKNLSRTEQQKEAESLIQKEPDSKLTLLDNKQKLIDDGSHSLGDQAQKTLSGDNKIQKLEEDIQQLKAKMNLLAGKQVDTYETIGRQTRQLTDHEGSIIDINNILNEIQTELNLKRSSESPQTPKTNEQSNVNFEEETSLTRTSTPSRNIKNMQVVSASNETKTVQLYKPDLDENKNTLQTVILSLPDVGNLSQYDSKSINLSTTNERQTSLGNNDHHLDFVPAVVTDDEHRINFSIEDSNRTSGVTAPFTYNVFDVSDKVDRAHVSRIKGILEAKINEICIVLQQLNNKEAQDYALLSKNLEHLQSQVAIINKKLDYAANLSVDADGNEKREVEGTVHVNTDEGKLVTIFVPPNDNSGDNISRIFADSLNGIIGRVDTIQNELDQLKKKNQKDLTDLREFMDRNLMDKLNRRILSEFSKRDTLFIDRNTSQIGSNRDSLEVRSSSSDKKSRAPVDIKRRKDVSGRSRISQNSENGRTSKMKQEAESPKTAWPKTEERDIDMNHSITDSMAADQVLSPTESLRSYYEDSSLEQRLLEKISLKADQEAVDILKEVIDSVIKKLKEMEIDVKVTATQAKYMGYEQLKDIEVKIEKKADRDEMTTMFEKFSQESVKNGTLLDAFPDVEEASAGEKHVGEAVFGVDNDDFNKIKDVVNKLASQMMQIMRQKADKIDVAKQVSEKTEQIEKLDQTKADANIVARKAEREYVDSLVDKLRKETESLVSVANNNTADLFSKDLAFLQSLIEEKAGKNDLKKIRDFLLHNQKEDHSTGEGLAGKKAYRCLSCNRTMNGMRTKPQSMNFTGFVNSLPNPKNRMYPKKAFLNDSITQARNSMFRDSGIEQSGEYSPDHSPGVAEEGDFFPLNSSRGGTSEDSRTSPPGGMRNRDDKLPSIN